MDWTRWRDEFPILGRSNYLNSCSLGALSRRSDRYVRDFLAAWNDVGAASWYENWMGRLEALRGRVAAMFGARDDEVAYAASVSAALAGVASAIDHRRRPRVVCAELDFPTIAYQWMARPDAEVVLVPSDDGATIDPARWADAVDDRTALIATSHVFFETGAIQDLRALAEIAHRNGALCLVDAYQSAGQMPIDMHGAGVDILIAGPLKWLMGGPGLAYAVVRHDLALRLTPSMAGWFGVAEQFDFDITRLTFRDDARRFELGTPSMPTVHAALGGQEIVDEIGLGAIRGRNRALTERLIDRARDAGFELRAATDPAQRSAIVMIRVDDAPAAVRALADQRIVVDARAGCVRVSPHFYNTEDDVDAAVAALRAVAAPA